MSNMKHRDNALKRVEINEIRRTLRRWYKSSLGRNLLEQESEQLDAVLNTLFGYHAVQVGFLVGNDLLASSRIPHQIIMDPARGDDLPIHLFAYPDALPIQSDMIDMVILPHTLEFERAPHEILREVDRVLIPEGHVVILGFNPWSMWGLVAWFRRKIKKTNPPWCGCFLSLLRIKDWLALLGFEVIHEQTFFFRPPVKQVRIMKRLSFMERLGQRYWKGLGGAYVLVARKRVTTLTPIKPNWRSRRSFVGKLVEPAASNRNLREK
ncbi:FIG005121: SAM-dependent methyltransferase [hydrothermal vent metagenome]|uniref:FIG005121: SAM-dependent methyltransferase n=1 Tax=hydrothermal vent metagenome TaxID=652676 RepID=A0A3B0Z701_9ZZZZ